MEERSARDQGSIFITREQPVLGVTRLFFVRGRSRHYVEKKTKTKRKGGGGGKHNQKNYRASGSRKTRHPADPGLPRRGAKKWLIGALIVEPVGEPVDDPKNAKRKTEEGREGGAIDVLKSSIHCAGPFRRKKREVKT